MRIIKIEKIIQTISSLCIEANTHLGDDIKAALEAAYEAETLPQARFCLETCLKNLEIAKESNLPICQDTGIAVVFAEIGQEVYIEGNLSEGINEGVRQGYKNGLLRLSVVKDPLERVNTGDNTPAIIHYNIVSGNKLKLSVLPKGFGAENMSALHMLNPSEGERGIIKAVIETVSKAKGNPCPPIIIGIGIGGTCEACMLASKRALLRKAGTKHPIERYGKLENELLEKVNALDIGPQGLGGKSTALAVHIEELPTHIAGLPVGINISCHVTRHATAVL